MKGKKDSVDTRGSDIEDMLDLMLNPFKKVKEENILLRKCVFQQEKDAKGCSDREGLKMQNIIIQGIPV